jgi:3-isopropylmalate/(R)-2-methylmalate dehydratase small subunit
MEALQKLVARTVVLPVRDIDTDQIIPARFLTTTTREGLGAGLFHDLRFDSSGNEDPEFPLNRPEADGCEILVAGNNFGCGSSREHAPWALLDFGLTAHRRRTIDARPARWPCRRVPDRRFRASLPDAGY